MSSWTSGLYCAIVHVYPLYEGTYLYGRENDRDDRVNGLDDRGTCPFDDPTTDYEGDDLQDDKELCNQLPNAGSNHWAANGLENLGDSGNETLQIFK